jgi:drug/metabolite transporter (DMT)-like permease
MKKSVSRRLQGGISLLIATVLYSFYGVFSRIVGVDFGEVFQITARFSFMFIFFFLYVLLRKKWKKIASKDYKWFFLMIIPGMIAAIIVFIVFNYIPLGTAYFTLYAASTLSSYLLGYLLFKEKINRIKVLSLIISSFGLYLIFSDSLEFGRISYLTLMLLAGLFAAAWNVISKKISSKYSINQILLVDSLVLVVISFPIAILLKESVSLPSLSTQWIGIFLYAVVAVAASIATVNGYKLLQAQIGSLIMLMEPFFAAIIGWLLYSEILTPFVLMGGLLIAIGASLPNLKYLSKLKA